MKIPNSIHNNKSGFIVADFLFSIVLVMSSCIILFTLCFSLASVEIAQYITWSSARSYSAANLTEAGSIQAGKIKFAKLSAKFPLLTGQGAETSWFELNLKDIGNNTALIADLQQININNSLASGEPRQPWTGAATELDVSLFRRMQLPFIGGLSTDDDAFKFQLRAFILRNPSQDECLQFFKKKYTEGVSRIENSWNSKSFLTTKDTDFIPQEDNGC
jgi:hypothetical protein